MRDHRKPILNNAERETSEELNAILSQHGCVLFAKVRIADVLDIQDSGLTDEEYHFALGSHFDFIVAGDSDMKAHFAVEYDGPRHRSDSAAKRRDRLKDAICEKLYFSLLRLDGEFLY